MSRAAGAEEGRRRGMAAAGVSDRYWTSVGMEAFWGDLRARVERMRTPSPPKEAGGPRKGEAESFWANLRFLFKRKKGSKNEVKKKKTSAVSTSF